MVGRARKDPGLRHGAASSLAPAAVALVSGCGGAKPGASLPDSSVTTTPGESSGRAVLAAIGSHETYLCGKHHKVEYDIKAGRTTEQKNDSRYCHNVPI